MREGFYVSPCGEHIIEIVESRYNCHIGWFIVVNLPNDHYMEHTGDNSAYNLQILLSCWEFLK